MNRLTTLAVLAGLAPLVTGCGQTAAATTNDPEVTTTITVRNETDHDRTDELILLQRNRLPDLGEQLPVVLLDGSPLPQQHDDLDGDGAWDELAVLVGADAGAVLELTLAGRDSLPHFTPRTGVRLGLLGEDGQYRDVSAHRRPADHRAHDPLYHVEGVSWENDRIGFRNYFDERNGKDIFGKRVPDLVLDTVSLGSAYHDLADWGMDILKVGNSLGAGALAVRRGTGELLRLGPTTTADYRLVTRGPVRSIFELTYTGWAVGLDSLSLTERITVTPGNNHYRSQVTVDGFSGTDLELVTGIVNMQSERTYTDFRGQRLAGLATWDRQSFIGDGLGMALVYDRGAAVGEAPAEGPGIVQTYYVALPLRPRRPNTFYFIAGWETAEAAYGSAAGFLDLVQTTIDRLERPLTITVN